jgi:hypothetical protein
MDKGITREQIERAARLYKTNMDASQALGIAMRSFGRLCRRYGIETPWVRKRRRRQAARCLSR